MTPPFGLSLTVQFCQARDFFDDCTVTIEQWIAAPSPDPSGPSPVMKWKTFIAACALVADRMDGLRQEPRVGYDPRSDRSFFIFKQENNGDTFLVSRDGIPNLGDVVYTQ